MQPFSMFPAYQFLVLKCSGLGPHQGKNKGLAVVLCSIAQQNVWKDICVARIVFVQGKEVQVTWGFAGLRFADLPDARRTFTMGT
mmetsp:Transcript_98970/g.166705  ORF Transcript_98970/g.166705 Transcript_98970/m.166705 type:complete len:85 (-) Transcript_98970:46-300(-)